MSAPRNSCCIRQVADSSGVTCDAVSQVAREAAGGSNRPADRPGGIPQITPAHQHMPTPAHTPNAAAHVGFNAPDNRWQMPNHGQCLPEHHHAAFPYSNPHMQPPPMEPSAPPSLFATSHYDPVMTPDACNGSLLGGSIRGMHNGGSDCRPDTRGPFMGDSLTSLAGISLRRRSAPLSPAPPQARQSASPVIVSPLHVQPDYDH